MSNKRVEKLPESDGITPVHEEAHTHMAKTALPTPVLALILGASIHAQSDPCDNVVPNTFSPAVIQAAADEAALFLNVSYTLSNGEWAETSKYADAAKPGEFGNEQSEYKITLYPQTFKANFPDISQSLESYSGCTPMDGFDNSYTAGVLAATMMHEFLHVCCGHGKTQSSNGQNGKFSCSHLAIETAVTEQICKRVMELIDDI